MTHIERTEDFLIYESERPPARAQFEVAGNNSQQPTQRPMPGIDRGGSAFFWVVKRSLDIAAATALLPIVTLVGLALLCANPFFNPGPLFYTQIRTGRNLRRFRMWKFRTMTGSSDQARFATSEAARITPLGALLRASHIDEMPQAWNVLIGDMSLIGPRPEQEDFARDYLAHIPAYRLRYMVRPGVTGLAQVEYRYTDCLKGTRQKLRYDLLYIRSSGFRSELSILAKTWRVLLRHIADVWR